MKRYFIESVGEIITSDPVRVYFNKKDALFAKKALDLEIRSILELKDLFNVSPEIFINIVIYPDKEEMEKAFGRNLPDDQCCFAPVKGKESLITFTSKILPDSLNHVLVHETCHIIFNEITGNYETGKYTQAMPVWLDEGLALYFDSKYRKNVDEVENKRLALFKNLHGEWFPDLMGLYTYFNRLDEDREFGPRGQLAYAYSYFCVKSLVLEFGFEKVVEFVKELHSDKDFEKLFFSCFNTSIRRFNSVMKNKLT